MNKQEFLASITELADKAKKSDDEAVAYCAVILTTMKGALLAGRAFLDPLVDSAVAIAERQFKMLGGLQ